MNQIPLLPFSLSYAIDEHSGSQRSKSHRIPCGDEAAVAATAAGAEWNLSLQQTGESTFTLAAEITAGTAREVAFGLSLVDDQWTTDNYVLIPGAVYGGNRFHAKQYNYSPPAVGSSRQDSDRTPHIGDIPRLNLEDGPSHLDQMSIDAATPALAVYFPKQQKALCLFTKQAGAIGPFGYEIIESDDRSQAEILLMLPGLRHDKYFTINGYTADSPDRAADLPAGSQVELPFHLHWIDCHSVQQLFDFVFAHRYDAMPTVPMRQEIPFSATWQILHEKHNRENWRPEHQLYQVSINQDPPNPFMLFQTGWVGGMMTPYPMLQEGDAVSFDRALQNMALFFSGAQTDFGLFHEYYYQGEWKSYYKITYTSSGTGTFKADPAK